MRWLRRLMGRGRYHRLLDELTASLRAGDHRAAAATATRCVELAESMFGDEDPELVAPLYALASAELARGRHDPARQACERALRVAAGAHACEPPLHQIWEQRAAIADRSGDEEAFERALREVVQGTFDDPAFRATAHNRLGLLLGRAGRFPDAAEQFAAALELRERLEPDGLAVAEVLHNQATFRDPERDLVEGREPAVVAFERALGIASKHLSAAASLLEARVAHNLAVLHQERLRSAEAEASYRRALAAFERDHDERDPALRPTLARLGRLLQMSGRFEEAVTYLTRAHAIAESELGLEHDITSRLAVWLGDANSATYR